MALPNDSPLSKVLEVTHQRWVSTKRNAQAWSAEMQSPMPASQLLGRLRMAEDQLAHLNAAASRPGIGAYATDQWGGTYDIAPDFGAFTTALQAVIDEIKALAPVVTESDTGKADPTFSVAEMADLRTALDNLAATVE